jgi:hypothetical protein
LTITDKNAQSSLIEKFGMDGRNRVCDGRKSHCVIWPFLLSRRAVLADQPSLVPWKMLLPLVPYPLGRTVGSTHTDGGKPGYPWYRCANSQFSTAHWPTCLQLLSIDYPARAVYLAGLELW